MTKDAITSQSPEEVRQQKYRFSLLCSGIAKQLSWSEEQKDPSHSNDVRSSSNRCQTLATDTR